MKTLIIETDRLLLRPFEDADLPALTRLYANPDVMRFVAPVRSAVVTQQHLRKHQNDLAQYGFGLLAATNKSDGRFIGRCGLDPLIEGGAPQSQSLQDQSLNGELAWMFFPEYWGQGLATEFGSAMIQTGFNELKLSRIIARADPNNLASIRVMQKLGMSRVEPESESERVQYEVSNPQQAPADL